MPAQPDISNTNISNTSINTDSIFKFVCLFSDNSLLEVASREEAVKTITHSLSRFARRHGDRIGWNFPHPSSGFVAQHPDLDGRPTWACVYNGMGEQQEPSGVILPIGFLEGKGITVIAWGEGERDKKGMEE